MMKAMHALIIVALLLLSQPSAASLAQPAAAAGVFSEAQLHFGTWMPIFIVTLAIMLGIATLVYMVGIALGMQNVKMWAKSEFANIVAMLLLVLVIIAALNVSWDVSTKITTISYVSSGAIAPAGGVDQFTLARAYLNQSIKCEREVYKWVFRINALYETFEKYSIDIAGPEGHSGSIYGVATGFYHYITGNLTYLMIFQYVQLRFLDFIQVVMMTLFLPIGIVLRTFAPTRGAGGLMIAIAIGFYFVFPMSYVFIYASAPTMDSACLKIQQTQLPLLEEDACYTNLSDIYVQQAKFKAQEGTITSLVEMITTTVASFLFHAIFYPLIALIVTFTFVRQVGAILGADLAEIGKGLIKLI